MPYVDPEKRKEAARARYAKRVEQDPAYSQRRSAEHRKKNPDSARVRQARYRSNHPQTVEQKTARRQYNDAYYQKHGEELRTAQRIRNANAYAINPAKSQAATKRWAQAHPDKGTERQSRRRARQREAPVVESVNRLVVAERDRWICQLCNKPIDPKMPYKDQNGKCNPGYLHIDHAIPLSKGGEHSYANSQATHAICNKRKSAKTD